MSPKSGLVMMLPLLAGLRVGRPRTRPDRVPADKAYSSRAIRAHLRARGIGSVIPEPDDQKAHRKRRGSRGGRPVTEDRNAYRGRNVIERAFNGLKHRRGLATRDDKHATDRALVLAAALLWLNDLSGVVASVLGVEHAFGELRPALVRRGGELHENGGAPTTFEPTLLERVKNFSFAAAVGACGKPRVVPHNRRPKPEPTEMGVVKCVCWLRTTGSRGDATNACEGVAGDGRRCDHRGRRPDRPDAGR